jgi:hypothetical protein
MIKSYQPQSGSEPAMGLLVPRAAAAAAAAGQPLVDHGSAEELEGDYSWDCEYSFDLIVSARTQLYASQGSPGVNMSAVHMHFLEPCITYMCWEHQQHSSSSYSWHQLTVHM